MNCDQLDAPVSRYNQTFVPGVYYSMDDPNPYTPPQSDAADVSGLGNARPNRVLALIGAPFRWLFAPQRRAGTWRAIVWWESRESP